MRTNLTGFNSVQLPSLNFNHCIVKVFVDDKPMYLELSDPYLPFGYTKRRHRDAIILDINQENTTRAINIAHLKENPAFLNYIGRQTSVKLGEDMSITAHHAVIRTGAMAAATCSDMLIASEEDRVNNVRKSVQARLDTDVNIENLSFDRMTALDDTVLFSFDYTARNELEHIGDQYVLPMPFQDVLVTKEVLNEDDRTYDFNFINYEETNHYLETIEIENGKHFNVKVVPADIHLSFKDNHYDLIFKKSSSGKITVTRSYRTDLKNISKEDFEDFRVFVQKVLDAENTKIVFNKV